MVQAWYMDDSNDDQRLEHHRVPPKYISLDDLFRQTGVEYFKVNEKDPGNDALLNSLKKERNYSYEDEITCSEECLPNYHEKLKNFFTEHLHTDEEIRLVLEGSGYFDVRSPTEEWIRIYVTCGDLIIIPAGIYHRFTLDSKNYIKAKRYFIGEPVWTPYNRPADEMPCRKEYLAKMVKGGENAVVQVCQLAPADNVDSRTRVSAHETYARICNKILPLRLLCQPTPRFRRLTALDVVTAASMSALQRRKAVSSRTSIKAERTQKGSDPVRQLPKNDDKVSGLVKPFETKKVEPVQPKIPDLKPEPRETKPEIKPKTPDTPKDIFPEPKTPETFRPDTKPKTPDTPKNILPEPKTPEIFRPDTKPITPDTPKNILPEPKTPESFRPDTKPKTPDTPKNILPEPKTPESFRPDTKPKTPDTPKNILPEPKTPESFRPDTKPKTPDTPKNILPEPKTPETPKNVGPEPKTPESPKPTTPGTAKAPEFPKREPPKVPNRRQEPPKTPESPKPISRDDEMLGRQINRSPGINGAGPRQFQPDPKDLSYSAHEVARPFPESALSFTKRERSVPSNPDSLEASEEED